MDFAIPTLLCIFPMPCQRGVSTLSRMSARDKPARSAAFWVLLPPLGYLHLCWMSEDVYCCETTLGCAVRLYQRPRFRMNEWRHTLSYLLHFIFVACPLDPAVVDSSSVTAGTGHFSRNSLKILEKNSFNAGLPFCFASMKAAFRGSSQFFCSLVVQVWRTIFPNM